MHHDLEPQAATYVGQLVFAFSRLDFMLAAALRNLVPCSSPDDLNPMIERLGFKERMDSLQEAVTRSATLGVEAKAQFKAWHKKADQLRVIRNAFVHGRWGVQSHDSVFNAKTGSGKTFTGQTTTYTLAQLNEQWTLAKAVLDEFHDWHMRNVLGAA